MIIAVNIGKALAAGKPVRQATERAWALDIKKCIEHDYVIGVEKGQIRGCFKLKEVIQDHVLPNRVAFKLDPCSEQEEKRISSHIRVTGINIGGVQKGKYI